MIKDVADGTHEARPALVLPDTRRERRVALLGFVSAAQQNHS
jgi:hypothetical protein